MRGCCGWDCDQGNQRRAEPMRESTKTQIKTHLLMPHCAMVAPVDSLTLLLGILAPLSSLPASAEAARLEAVGEEGRTAELSMRDMGARVLDREPVEGEREWKGVPRGEGL